MNKRLGAGLLAAASAASVLGVVGAQPAAAAPTPCGTYPPGLAYALQIVPASARVHIGTVIAFRGTLTRGHSACVGFPMGAYEKPATRSFYALVPPNQTTDSTGSIRNRTTINATKRLQMTVRFSATARIHSSISEFVVVP